MLSVINITHRALVNQFKIKDPKLVVCGLNPHAGESGAFGDEEIVHIAPAVAEARKLGITVTGPLPADTLFYYANEGKWDAVVAMYHDQGLIPFKMLSFNVGVNLTLGLPIIRTSPDHGTAFNIAWKGIADPSSMIAAVIVASRLAVIPEPARNKRVMTSTVNFTGRIKKGKDLSGFTEYRQIEERRVGCIFKVYLDDCLTGLLRDKAHRCRGLHDS